MSINRAIISGNLTRDADLRATTSGTSVLSFSVAVNERRKNNQTGDWEDYPNYIDCILFGKRAEGLSKYMLKGTKVIVEGKLRWSQWIRDDEKRSKIEVVVDEIEFMSARKDSDQNTDNTDVSAVEDNNEPIPVEPVVDASIYDHDISF